MAAPHDALVPGRLRVDDRPALQFCGAVIRHHRLARGWRQHELAAQIGLTSDAISALELGKAWLSVRHLLDLADVLNLEFWHLFPPRATSPGAAALRLLPFVPPTILAAVVELLRPRPMLPTDL